MSELSHLSFDVFLSYGWAGIPGADDADRGWVNQFKQAFEGELSAELGRHARVHLDVEQSNNGELPANLRDRVAGSAIFLSVITRGSVRDGSWCHSELDWFLNDAPQVLEGRRQIFSLLLRDVEQSAWPAVLRPIVPTPFLVTDGTTRRPAARGDLADARTEAGARVQTLAVQVARTLESIERNVARTVMLAGGGAGADSFLGRLDVEITRRGGAVVCLSPGAGEDESSYARRFARALNGASLLVYVAGDGPAPMPAGWSRTVEHVHMQAAAARFGPDPRQSIVWRVGASASGAEWPSAQVLKDLGFEYLHTLMCQTLENNVSAAEARVALRQEQPRAAAAAGAPSPRYIFVECVQSDLQRLLPLREAFRQKGFVLKFPLFQGDPDLRRRADLQFLMRCDAAAVYFGSRNDLEAYLACQTLEESLTEHAVAIPRVVLLDPYSDPVRQSFVYPDFANLPYEPDQFVAAIAGAAS
jgi:hypothetical protein